MSEFTEGVTAPEKKEEGTKTEEPSSYIAAFVGEGKQYTTVDEAAEALAKKALNADKHIETLITEKKTVEQQLQEERAKGKSIEEVLAAINDTKEPVQMQQTQQQQEANNLTIEDVANYLKEQQTATSREQAKASAWDKLASEDVFGDLDKAKIAVAEYIKDNPARKAVVDTLAVSDHSELIRILKPEGKKVVFSETQEGFKFEGLPSGKLTWEIAQEVRKKDPKLYNSHAFKKRMHEEIEL